MVVWYIYLLNLPYTSTIHGLVNISRQPWTVWGIPSLKINRKGKIVFQPSIFRVDVLVSGRNEVPNSPSKWPFWYFLCLTNHIGSMWLVYLPINIYHTNQPNLGKYTRQPWIPIGILEVNPNYLRYQLSWSKILGCHTPKLHRSLRRP